MYSRDDAAARLNVTHLLWCVGADESDMDDKEGDDLSELFAYVLGAVVALER